jgi:hypothetical protein
LPEYEFKQTTLFLFEIIELQRFIRKKKEVINRANGPVLQEVSGGRWFL